MGTKPEVKVISIKDVVVAEGRIRQDKGDLLAMAESIKKHGIIHPLAVWNIEGKYQLIAGERRYRGALYAGLAEIPVRIYSDATEVDVKEIELEENVRRKDISWEEEIEALRQLDELKKQKDKEWTQEKTAETANIDPGWASKQIRLAETLKDRPDLRERVKGLPFKAAYKRVEQIQESEQLADKRQRGVIRDDINFELGNCLDRITELDDESCDLLITDPPYGLENIEKLRKGGNIRLSYAFMSDIHNMNIDDVCELLTELSKELNRVLKPSAHGYVFCGAQHVGRFIEAMKPCFTFKPPVLVWDKEITTTPGYGFSYMSRTESIIFFIKEPTKRMLTENMANVFRVKPTPKQFRIYNSEKPLDLLKTFIKNSSDPGSRVIDPFAGSASTLLACKETNRYAIGYEMDKEIYHRALERLRTWGEGLE